MFYSLQLKQRRQNLTVTDFYNPAGPLDDISVSTIDTQDLDEYLVDDTDGMDREFDIEDGMMAHASHLHQEALENYSRTELLRHQWTQWGKGNKDRNCQTDTASADHGQERRKRILHSDNLELIKRKPPDGNRREGRGGHSK